MTCDKFFFFFFCEMIESDIGNEVDFHGCGQRITGFCFCCSWWIMEG